MILLCVDHDDDDDDKEEGNRHEGKLVRNK